MGLDQYIYISKKELEEDYYEVLGEATENEYGDVFYDEESVLTEIAYFRKSNFGFMAILIDFAKKEQDMELKIANISSSVNMIYILCLK